MCLRIAVWHFSKVAAGLWLGHAEGLGGAWVKVTCDKLYSSTLSLEQTADAGLPGAINPGQGSVLAEWEMSTVYIMF